MILMIVSGLMTMVYTIITIVNKDESEWFWLIDKLCI